MQITLSLAIPVVCVLVLIFVLWSVLMRAYDLTHVPLLLVSLASRDTKPDNGTRFRMLTYPPTGRDEGPTFRRRHRHAIRD